MQQVICPIDNKPCEVDCPDRYRDALEGGCLMTTAMEFGVNLLILKEATNEERESVHRPESNR